MWFCFQGAPLFGGFKGTPKDQPHMVGPFFVVYAHEEQRASALQVRKAITADPGRAAKDAIKALGNLAEARQQTHTGKHPARSAQARFSWNSQLSQPQKAGEESWHVAGRKHVARRPLFFGVFASGKTGDERGR